MLDPYEDGFGLILEGKILVIDSLHYSDWRGMALGFIGTWARYSPGNSALLSFNAAFTFGTTLVGFV